jgi:hypothetical protein
LNKPLKIKPLKQVASRIIGWPEISDYIGRRKEMEE